MQPTNINDKLAIERTHLANERTLLSYVRTALGLVAAGAGLLQFFSGSRLWLWMGWALIAAGGLMTFLGVVRFFMIRLRLQKKYD